MRVELPPSSWEGMALFSLAISMYGDDPKKIRIVVENAAEALEAKGSGLGKIAQLRSREHHAQDNENALKAALWLRASLRAYLEIGEH